MLNDLFELIGALLFIVALTAIGAALHDKPELQQNPFQAAAEAMRH